MKSTSRIRSFAIVIVFAALFAGCAANSTAPATPPVPTPPQITAANAVNALAQTLDATITTLRAARDQGKLAARDVAAAETVAAIIATAGKQIDAELKSADLWVTQKAVILKIITSSGLEGAYTNLPTAVVSYVAAAVALFDQVSSAVGGPTI